MNEAVVKEEVIEEDHNFTFKNGEFAEVEQEEIEQKPEHLLEKEIKAEPIEFFEKNNSDGIFEDVQPEPKECDHICSCTIKKASKELSTLICKICQKRMPRNLLKWIKSDEDKIVLSQNFEIKGFLGTKTSYVCYSHIQSIIDNNDGKLKLPKTPYEKLLRSFITKNKNTIKERKSRRCSCQICHIIKPQNDIYEISSNRIRMVIMVGCILRGTHSVEQAKSYIRTRSKGFTCYSHCKESIDMIFEHLGVGNIREFLLCPTQKAENSE
ncbi:hypothetical protein B9Z55_021096 [Caenorhabditis nigoni]|uniref:Lin-15A/B-like domain-containing protein n=1 Tax=Caenorhabditis nigoni TaxID=1611254 RepID=A0A2G5TQN9_9PELO|nr:hypothetical protein B9Z55_021096 [Caenorhabditis nigoni]